jgi:hypothetical protein
VVLVLGALVVSALLGPSASPRPTSGGSQSRPLPSAPPSQLALGANMSCPALVALVYPPPTSIAADANLVISKLCAEPKFMDNLTAYGGWALMGSTWVPHNFSLTYSWDAPNATYNVILIDLDYVAHCNETSPLVSPPTYLCDFDMFWEGSAHYGGLSGPVVEIGIVGAPCMGCPNEPLRPLGTTPPPELSLWALCLMVSLLGAAGAVVVGKAIYTARRDRKKQG